MKLGGVRFLASVLHKKQNNSQSEIFYKQNQMVNTDESQS